MTSSSSRAWQSAFLYLAGFVGLVLIPGLLTATVPVSVIRLQRQGAEVSAHVKTNVFFCIPYRQQHLERVTSADDRFRAGSYNRKERTHAEDKAFLVLHGRTGDVEVSVSPVDIDTVLEKAQAFITDGAGDLRLVVVANWKFGVIGGGFVSLFTLFYVLGVTLSLLRLITRLVRRVAGAA